MEKKFSKNEVDAMMKELGIVGYSSMGEFSPTETMHHLLEIKRVMGARERGETTDAFQVLLGDEQQPGVQQKQMAGQQF